MKVTPDPFEKQRWEQTLTPQEKLAFENGSTPVPPIQLFSSIKKASVKNKKFQIEALNVKSATKHQNLVYHLLSQASQHHLLPQDARIIPHCLEPRDIMYEGVVNGHTAFISRIRVIPIIGLTREAAEYKAPNDISYLHHIAAKMNALTIQPTSRTDDLGKWLIQVKQEDYVMAENYINIEWPRPFQMDIPSEMHVQGFPFPRRTQIPLRTEAMGAYANTLRDLAKEGMDLPLTPPKKPWPKQPPVVFHHNKEDFPPLRSSPNQSSTDKPQASSQKGNTRIQDSSIQ